MTPTLTPTSTVAVALPNGTTLFDVEIVLRGTLRGKAAVLVRWRDAGEWWWRWVLKGWIQ